MQNLANKLLLFTALLLAALSLFDDWFSLLSMVAIANLVVLGLALYRPSDDGVEDNNSTDIDDNQIDEIRDGPMADDGVRGLFARI